MFLFEILNARLKHCNIVKKLINWLSYLFIFISKMFQWFVSMWHFEKSDSFHRFFFSRNYILILFQEYSSSNVRARKKKKKLFNYSSNIILFNGIRYSIFSNLYEVVVTITVVVTDISTPTVSIERANDETLVMIMLIYLLERILIEEKKKKTINIFTTYIRYVYDMQNAMSITKTKSRNLEQKYLF